MDSWITLSVSNIIVIRLSIWNHSFHRWYVFFSHSLLIRWTRVKLKRKQEFIAWTKTYFLCPIIHFRPVGWIPFIWHRETLVLVDIQQIIMKTFVYGTCRYIVICIVNLLSGHALTCVIDKRVSLYARACFSITEKNSFLF